MHCTVQFEEINFLWLFCVYNLLGSHIRINFAPSQTHGLLFSFHVIYACECALHIWNSRTKTSISYTNIYFSPFLLTIALTWLWHVRMQNLRYAHMLFTHSKTMCPGVSWFFKLINWQKNICAEEMTKWENSPSLSTQQQKKSIHKSSDRSHVWWLSSHQCSMYIQCLMVVGKNRHCLYVEHN